MSDYRRVIASGDTFFFTQVTYQIIPWLCSDIGRENLRKAIKRVQQLYPFSIDAIALLPEHIYRIWTLPEVGEELLIKYINITKLPNIKSLGKSKNLESKPSSL